MLMENCSFIYGMQCLDENDSWNNENDDYFNGVDYAVMGAVVVGCLNVVYSCVDEFFGRMRNENNDDNGVIALRNDEGAELDIIIRNIETEERQRITREFRDNVLRNGRIIKETRTGYWLKDGYECETHYDWCMGDGDKDWNESENGSENGSENEIENEFIRRKLHNGEETVCSICLDELGGNRRYTMETCCGHEFHKTCFDRVIKKGRNNYRCPNCRHEQPVLVKTRYLKP